MSDIDKAIARVYLELAADLALRAANIASACDGQGAQEMQERGDKAYEILKPYAHEVSS